MATSKKAAKSKKEQVEVPDYDKLEIDETVYQTTVPERFKHRKPWTPHKEGEVCSLIAGIVREIKVEQGVEVQEGDCIMVLEAMKMYNEILAPVSGMVEEILVQPNINIPKGTLMIKIKPKAKDTPSEE